MPPNIEIPNDFDYAITEEEAKKRFGKWQTIDPFPQIFPALLNSADIADYVLATGMIWPFSISKLKSAAYEMVLGNEFLYWNDKSEEIHETVEDGTTISLQKNSITYVTLKETFFLPDYIALRFNLTINHVHKGLLLGTGPLVNPGFQGKLMVPIHNLTPNEYPLRPGDSLISVEFTKLSPIDEWTIIRDDLKRPALQGKYVQKHKRGSSFEEYIKRALPHGTTKVESSLSHALESSKLQINEIKNKADAEISRAALYRNIVAAGTLLGVAALAWMTWQIFQSNSEFISQSMEKNIEMVSSVNLQQKKINILLEELEKVKVLELKLESIETELRTISTRSDAFNSETQMVHENAP